MSAMGIYSQYSQVEKADDASDVASFVSTDKLTGSQPSSLGLDLHRRRRCTDGFCLAFLLAFLLGMAQLYRHARTTGNLAKLTHGFDWKGSICGVDPAVQDKPFLFWCSPNGNEDLTLLDGVCVSKCPTTAGQAHWCPGPARTFQINRPIAGDQQSKEVVIGMRRNLTMTRGYATVEAFGYCFPEHDLTLMQQVLERTHVSSVTKQVILAGQGAVESWHFLVAVAVASVAIGYVFLFVLWNFFDKLLFALLVAAHIVLLATAGAFAYVSFHQEHNIFRNYFSEAAAQICAWACSGVAFVVWIFFALLCCHSRDAMAVTIDSVKAACEVIERLPIMLLQPLLHSAVLLVLLLASVYGLAWLLSVGKVVPQGSPLEQSGVQISGLHRSLEFTEYEWACIAYWIFGVVWILETVNALGQFAISHAVVMYAVHDEEECCPMFRGYFIGLVFHLGSLAFGGFITSCLKIVAALLSFAVRQTRDEYGAQGAVTQVLCCCCMCTVLCIERVVSMVNELVYSDVALQSSSYVEAADNVVRIATSNPLTYASIKSSATAIRVVGVTMIGGCGTFLAYLVLSSNSFHRQLDSVFENSSSMLVTSNIIGTTVASGLVCFYVAMAFMMVFYQTTLSLMYCMLISTDGRALPTGSAATLSRMNKV